MITSISRRHVIALVGLAVILPLANSSHAGEISRQSVARAQRFLDSPKRGKFITSYLHFGSDHTDHNATKVLAVTNPSGKTVPGHFALVYKFEWDDTGYTNVAFFFDEDGDFYEIRALDHNAIINVPFLKADLSIAILGSAILELLKDQMTPEQIRDAKRIIEAGSSKDLLEMALRVQQALGT